MKADCDGEKIYAKIIMEIRKQMIVQATRFL
jgi:hypothetical protein